MATEPAIPNTILAPDTGPRGRRRSWLGVFLILFSAFFVMIAITAYGAFYSVQSYWLSGMRQEIIRNLTQKAEMLAGRIETDHTTPMTNIISQEGLHAGARATIIDANGRVIADSQAPIASLDNEGRLPEFSTALRGETAIVTRTRNGIPIAFAAVPVAGGAVRLAYPMADLEIAKQRFHRMLALGCAVGVVAALGIAALTARTLVHR